MAVKKPSRKSAGKKAPAAKKRASAVQKKYTKTLIYTPFLSHLTYLTTPSLFSYY